MRIYIKEWPNKTASIITAEGQVIWTFSSSETARQACRETSIPQPSGYPATTSARIVLFTLPISTTPRQGGVFLLLVSLPVITRATAERDKHLAACRHCCLPRGLTGCSRRAGTAT